MKTYVERSRGADKPRSQLRGNEIEEMWLDGERPKREYVVGTDCGAFKPQMLVPSQSLAVDVRGTRLTCIQRVQ